MVIGVDDALILAGVAAASGAAGYFGTQSQNAANRQMNAGQMAYQWGVDQWQTAKAFDMMREQYQLSDKAAWDARDWSAALMRENRDWTQNMSNTAYQRAMRDMRSAGLNPILAYAQGGASTPQMATPSTPVASTSGSVPGAHGAPAVARMENALGPAVSSALQGANAVMGVRQAAASIDQTQAATKLAAEQAKQAQSQTALNSAQAVTEAQRAGLVKSQRATEMVMPSLRAAQTSATSAQGVLAGEQASTEPERRSLMREQGRQAAEAANLNRANEHNVRTYGPAGAVSSTVGGVSQIINSIGESVGRYLR